MKNQYGLMAPWEGWRKALVIFLVVLGVALTFLSIVPIGMMALIVFWLFIVPLWKSTSDTQRMDTGKAQYMPETRAYDVAMFFDAARMSKQDMNAAMLIGMGPPREDVDHGIESASFTPPFRLSSWWGLAGALMLATLDIPMSIIDYSVLGFTLPWFVAMPLSAVGWFVIIQFCTEISRRRASADGGLVGNEPAPAVMINLANWKSASIGPAIINGAVTAFFAFAVLMVQIPLSLPWWTFLVALVLFFVVGFTIGVCKQVTEDYRTEWQSREDDRETFETAWAQEGDKAPVFMDSEYWPSMDEWAMKHPDEPYSPHIKMTRCVFADGMRMNDYLGKEELVTAGLSATQMVFVPFPERNEEGRDIPGTAGLLGFSIWATEEGKRYDMGTIFDDDAERIEKEFAIRHNILKGLREIKSIGVCYLVSFSLLTRPKRMLKDPGNNKSLVEIKVKPSDPSVSINNFRDPKVIEALKQHFQVDYVRAHKDRRSEGNVITLLIGDTPYDNIEFRRPPSLVMKTIRDADFSHVFHVNKISSAAGTPKLKDFQQIGVVEEQEFSLPDGLSFADVSKMKKAIMENTGNAFMEIKMGSSEALSSSKKSRRGRGKAKTDTAETLFSITSAKENPLNRMFKFMDYKDQILPGRKVGEPVLSWHPGVKSNDTLATDDFEADIPHLLIAGSSGSGKHLHVNTQIFTVNRGWVTMGDVVAGDVVLDAYGDYCTVTDAFHPVSLSTYHEISFSTGETITASPTHLWSVVPPNAPVLSGVTDVDLNVDMIWDHGQQDGSAWFRDDNGHAKEATSWIDTGAMEESHPHVSSRIAQSAIKGIHPFLWGWLFTQFGTHRAISGLEITNAPVSVRNVCEALYGAHRVHSDGTMGLPDRLEKLLAMAWEDNNSVIGIVRDVVDTLGWDLDILSGVVTGIGVDSELSASATEALRVFDVDTADIPAIQEKVHTRYDSILHDAQRRAAEANNYVCGLQDAMKSSGGYTVIWDASVRYHLLTHGIITGVVRSVGVELIPLPEVEFSLEHPVSYLRGYNSQLGVVSSELGVSAPVVGSRVRDVVNSTDYALLSGDTVVTAHKVLSGLSADHLDSDFIRDLFDADGNRLVSVPDLAGLTGKTIPDILLSVAGVKTAGVFRTPVLQKFATGNKAKVSGEWDLWRACDVVGHREVEYAPLFTGTSADIVAGSVVLREHMDNTVNPVVDPVVAGVAYSGVMSKQAVSLIPGAHRKGHVGPWVLADGTRFTDVVAQHDLATLLPDSWEYASAEWRSSFVDAYVQAGGDVTDGAYQQVKSSLLREVTVLDNVVVSSGQEMFRCISVDSPTRTYQAGSTLIPTHNSVVVQNMICQMIYNNDPADLRMWLLEPKIGLGRFQYYDTCERYVDSWTPTEDFFGNVAEWAHDLLEEMLRRNRLLSQYMDTETLQQPEKLSEGRQIAKDDGIENDDGTTHELWIPYILAFIEECGTVFAEAADKEQKAVQSQILVDMARLAREARAAGIYLICLTQYPTNASIPSVIRNQMRRVGLKCQNQLASRICIEEDGLEDLFIKGSGMCQGKGGIYEQFRGFFLAGGNPKKGEDNDILECLKDIPTTINGDMNDLGDKDNPYLDASEIDNSIFNLWQSTTGAQLERAVEAGQQTKNSITEDKLDKMGYSAP